MSSIIAITGPSGSGKTTLIEKLIPLLRQRGYIPGYVKHSRHQHFFDKKGKDTARQFTAGAAFTLINSDEAWMFHAPGAFRLEQIPLHPPCDLVLLEGFKDYEGPRVVCIGLDEPPPEPSANLLGIQCAHPEQVAALNQSLGEELAFHWDESAEEILDLLIPRWIAYNKAKRPLRVAILAGGWSRRMGQDKAGLDFGQGPHLAYLSQVIQKTTGTQPFVSLRPGQELDLGGLEPIYDRFYDAGPLGGLASLFMYDSEAAWLVLSADLACLEAPVLDELLVHRDPLKLASLLEREGLEPLAAIYEPRIAPYLQQGILQLKLGLIKLLEGLPVEHVSLPLELWPQLFNANQPDDIEKAQSYWRGRLASH